MSWLYSQALAEEYSEDIYSDGEPCAQLNVMATQRPFWRNDKMMDSSRLSRFGLTLKLLRVGPGLELLTSFLAAFPARTFHSPEKVKGSKENAADYGKSLPGLLAKYDRGTHSLKTAQLSLIEDSMSCSVTLPKSGTMRNGCVYQQQTVELTTSEIEFGFLPTPTTNEGNRNKSANAGAAIRPSLGMIAKRNLWPTPLASDGTKGSQGPNSRQTNLSLHVKLFPTPTASMISAGDLEQARFTSKKRPKYSEVNSGLLNPTWVEWLMGWPLGWTESKPLAMDKFLVWQQQHSLNCLTGCGNNRLPLTKSQVDRVVQCFLHVFNCCK